MHSRSSLLFLICIALCSALSIENALKTAVESGRYSTKLTTSSNDNAKMCGDYDTDCLAKESGALDISFVLSGMEHMDPQVATIRTSHYNDDICTQDQFHYMTEIVATVKRSNSIVREYDFHIQQGFFAVSEDYLKHLNCSAELTPKRSYPMKKYHCVDEEGKNPFADVEADIGRTVHYTIQFFDDALHLIYGSVAVPIPRVSDTGCDREAPLPLAQHGMDMSSVAWVVMAGVAAVIVVIAAALLILRKKQMQSDAETVLV